MSEFQEQATSASVEQTAKGYRTYVKVVQRKDETDVAFLMRIVDMQDQLNRNLQNKGYVIAPIEGGKKTETPAVSAPTP